MRSVCTVRAPRATRNVAYPLKGVRDTNVIVGSIARSGRAPAVWKLDGPAPAVGTSGLVESAAGAPLLSSVTSIAT